MKNAVNNKRRALDSLYENAVGKDYMLFRRTHAYGELEVPVYLSESLRDRSATPTLDDLHDIVEVAIAKPIYWSDTRCCYWMYDFKCRNVWVEMVQPADVSPYDALYINIYN